MQTKKHSAFESVVNVIAGYTTAIITQIVVFPVFGIETSTSDNMKIALIFTVISLIRSYVIRRSFNRWMK